MSHFKNKIHFNIQKLLMFLTGIIQKMYNLKTLEINIKSNESSVTFKGVNEK